MISKGNILYSVLYSKCPKCNEGKLFESKNPYHLKKFALMVDKCSVCGQSTQPEPGFYFGAMYVSYALAVGLGIALGGSMLYAGASAMSTVVAISLTLIFLGPLNFRWSRIIWLALFYPYDKNAGKAAR
jgi:uncharacterized protein (DUF983 family)